ncbi:transcriptional regulator, partial [Subtercola vilae]
MRRLVEESWQRSLERKLDPDHLSPAFDLDDEALREYRREHPLSRVLPVIHSLVIAHTFESGLIVAIGDQAGRLLWIDGDRDLRRRAEGMLFVEGANWSEAAVGTSAPGTALALDHGIQIGGEEHFNRIVHPWSCTAVPVHDPRSGEVLGVIDITGGDDAVSPSTLPLLEAAVAAAESELRIQQLGEPRRRPQSSSRVPFASAQSRPRRAPQLDAPQLSVLGRELGRLAVHGRELQLSARHSEILTLLAWHPRGLSAEQLAQKLYPADNSVATLRAEMVRLRAALATLDPC